MIGDVQHEIRQQLAAVGRVDHLRVEHHRIEAAALIRRDREGRVLRDGEHAETLGKAGDPVAVAHPDGIAATLVPNAGEERRLFQDLHIGPAELRRVTALHQAAELGRQGLLAVADSQHRDAGLEDGLGCARGILGRHAGRAARQDDGLRLEPREGRVGALEGVNFAINADLADAAGDELRDLAAEINDQDSGMGGRLGHGTR